MRCFFFRGGVVGGGWEEDLRLLEDWGGGLEVEAVGMEGEG